jgi:hypothetical protein
VFQEISSGQQGKYTGRMVSKQQIVAIASMSRGVLKKAAQKDVSFDSGPGVGHPQRMVKPQGQATRLPAKS